MRIYNSRTRQKEEFVSQEEGIVKIYACGPTVYDYFHIGNARPFIVFDVLRSHLERMGYKVIFVQNFTDIDDKMIKRANEEGINIDQLANKFINEYFIDAKKLGIKPATFHPRATENINEIIDLIQKLINSGKAYISEGDVYFSVDSYSGYGCLCGQCIDDLISGARVDLDVKKKNPIDFVLWKAQKPGEPAWDSPFGKGRPGWHIECSAMAMKYLGETIDIHCGGKDLLFPHHENEIAQSEGATGKQFVKYWMHNGFINIDNEKMSKSLGNFFTIREISEKYDLEVIRMFMLLVHYRSPVNYSPELVEQAASSLQRLYTAKDQLNYLYKNSKNSDLFSSGDTEFRKSLNSYIEDFNKAMNDDLNTADAISVIFNLVKNIFNFLNINSPKILINETKELFLMLSNNLGLIKDEEETPKIVIELLNKRKEARINKDFKTSDNIRSQLQEMGYSVEDTSTGQKLRKLI